MSHLFPLDSLGLTAQQLAACKRADVSTAAELLLVTPNDLSKKFRATTTPQGVQELVRAVARAVTPHAPTLGLLIRDGEGDTDQLVLDDHGDTDRLLLDDHGGNGQLLVNDPGGNQLLLDIVGNNHDGTGDNAEHRRGTRPRRGWLSTGDAGMDRALGGGLRLGCLTEIAGESASGKSHLCMSLALAAQLPVLSRDPGGALILTSEREIATTRLVELAKPLLAAHDPTHAISVKSLLDRVMTNRVKDADALETLLIALPNLLQKHNAASDVNSNATSVTSNAISVTSNASSNAKSNANSNLSTSPLITGRRPHSAPVGSARVTPTPIRLLVLDSITALLRGDAALPNTSRGLADRSRFLCNVTDRLKALALEYNLAVVVINQVSDVFARPPPAPTPSPVSSSSQRYMQGPEPPMLYSTQSRWFSGQSAGYHKEASLGIVWANAVNTRIMLSRTGRRRTLDPDDLTPLPRKRQRRRTPNAYNGDANIQHDEGEEGDDEDVATAVGLHPAVDIRPTLIRRMHVVFSPHAPSSTLDYIITPSGVYSLQGSYKRLDLSEALRRRDLNARYAAKHAPTDSQVLQRQGTSSQVLLRQGARSQVLLRQGTSSQVLHGQADEDGDGVLLEEGYDEFGDVPDGFWEYEREVDLAEPLAFGADL